MSHLYNIEHLHTLGPGGTNCEKASYEWLEARGVVAGSVTLYGTLEEALEKMPRQFDHALMACIVYPNLHQIVFSNLDWLTLYDSFVCKTDEMVLAQLGSGSSSASLIASHPAPRKLIRRSVEYMHADSNVAAAELCLNGSAQACITTKKAALARGLYLEENFGAIDMGFCVHRVTKEGPIRTSPKMLEEVS